REDCGGRGATLLLPRDQDELEFLNDTLQKSGRSFWIGLWKPAAGTGWTWVNGSRLDRDRFQLELRDGLGDCGTVKGERISSEDCSTELNWICQKEPTKI
ncbi:KRBBA protein, partial [Pachycephala philippinensis]|nr:KRBBA protein [Pachycephala philippinensis]